MHLTNVPTTEQRANKRVCSGVMGENVLAEFRCAEYFGKGDVGVTYLLEGQEAESSGQPLHHSLLHFLFPSYLFLSLKALHWC